ncbi:MAG: DJ-1/PfpI family protein [Acidobacteria bacterium]|nr:DJ-1/PfpI family protein [Acidobacteriota bacterium]
MRVAFVIFERMTALDFVGVYDPVTRLRTMLFRPDLSWDICALAKEVRDPNGLAFRATKVGKPLGAYDAVIVPGGYGTRELMSDEKFIKWLRTAADCELKASICTGSLLFAAAGFLKGRRAATHPTARAELERYCAVSVERVVDEGDVVTAGGVTAAIDLGLHLCGRLAGVEAREKIRWQMDYPYTV